MPITRYQSEESAPFVVSGWRPSVPIGLPILKDLSLAHTVTSRARLEIIEGIKVEEKMIEEEFPLWSSAFE
jgi:hypothetical protein